MKKEKQMTVSEWKKESLRDKKLGEKNFMHDQAE